MSEFDPFQFFGLGSDADLRALKRAYAKKIREFRPDRDPKGFQIVQKHYEAALDVLQRRWKFEEPEADELEATRAQEQTHSDDELITEDQEDEDLARSNQNARKLREAMMLMTPDGRNDQLLREAVLREPPFFRDPYLLIEDELADYVACNLDISCSELTAISSNHYAHYFVHARIAHLLNVGRYSDAGRELLELTPGVIDDGDMAYLAASAARALVIDSPEEAQLLEPLFSGLVADDTEYVVDLYYTFLHGRVTLQRFCAKRADKESMKRVLALWGSIPERELADDAKDILKGFRPNPMKALKQLDRLKSTPLFVSFRSSSAAHWDPEYKTELSRADYQTLGATLSGRATPGESLRHFFHIARRAISAVTLSVILVLYAMEKGTQHWSFKMWVCAILVALFIIYLATDIGADMDNRYKSKMRARIARALMTLPCTLLDVADAMPGRRVVFDQRPKYRNYLNNDDSLHFLATIIEVAEGRESEGETE